MKIPMKILDYRRLVILNESSIRAHRKANLKPEQIPNDPRKQFIVNFHYHHQWKGQQNLCLSIILKPGGETAWLDVSPEEYEVIPVILVSELEWEAAVCVGTPPRA